MRREDRGDLRAHAGRPLARARCRPRPSGWRRSARPRPSCSGCWRTSSAGGSGGRRPACPPTSPTSCSAPRPTSCGTSSPATSTSSPARSRCGPTTSCCIPTTWPSGSTRTPSPSARCSARPSSARTIPSSRSTTCWSAIKRDKGLGHPAARRRGQRRIHRPLRHPDEKWDFRLEQVASINASGHKYGLVYPGVGWLVFRRPRRLPAETGVQRQLPRRRPAHVHVQLLPGQRHDPGPVLQLRATGTERLHERGREHARRMPATSTSAWSRRAVSTC